ncbi:Helicase domain protein [Desulfosarcina variabilis str. Montpellier]|uniref:helix-turn-helix domain-containing protein n=1 Tax=Desulfosarcina variabilis TaxID=2300 RepID=UPI003AFB2D09
MNATNPELQLAGEYVRHTGCNIFLTGKAGTGKTTFLQTLKQSFPKRLVVTAPTGVAAINAGGVTLHSFFQLPFGPFVPDGETGRLQYRFSRDKIDIIKNLDLLVIDEISMVRADLLDGVDAMLRRFRPGNEPFGGVQLLMIGDLFQLPPVVRDEEWTLLEKYYASPYFFSSTALQQTEMVSIELMHIYRQADDRFIALLNQVRGGRLDDAALTALNQRHLAHGPDKSFDGSITLCTHNRQADTINADRLGALAQRAHTFTADIEGDFPEHTFPTASSLALKKGAQVMFVRNDPSPDKQYFNGKIGTITHISSKQIRIRCPEDDSVIDVEPVTWENIEYTLNRETLEIKENKIGAFSQYPLRLAWAITIHKSQGLTFDRAIIDAQAAFAHGQVYVALSRCRTLEGMVLSTPLSSRAIKADPAVQRFNAENRQNQPTTEQLQHHKVQYQQRLLLACFDFNGLRARLRRLIGLILGNPGVVHVASGQDLRALQNQAEGEIISVGEKFGRQLQGLFAADRLPADDAAVLERITKASAYFQEKIEIGVGQAIPSLAIDSDNKAILKKVNLARKRLQEEIDVKLAAVKSCAQGFSADHYFRAISAAVTGSKPTTPKPQAATYSETDITHRDLFEILKAWRSEKAQSEGVAHFQVMHQKPLIQIAINLPDSLTALKNIKGIGKQLAKRYGEELVTLVGDYRKKHDIQTVTLPDPPPADEKPKKSKTPRGETKQISLAMFEKGLGIEEIAKARELVPATIEGHLAHFVETGTISIDRLVSSEKQKRIEKELLQPQTSSFKEVKQALGADVSYGEIKLVQAHLNKTKKD